LSEDKEGDRFANPDGDPTIREPDIAFWFDEKDPTIYEVRYGEKLLHVQLIQASFELLIKAIKTDGDTLLMSYKE